MAASLAGFSAQYGIILCSNFVTTKGMLEDSLAHEMVHAYDALRFRFDPLSIRHAACTEIRASALSGECRLTREFLMRGQFKLRFQFQECVKRRAAGSLLARPFVKDAKHAHEAVEKVWESCFNDTRPFDDFYK